MQITYELTERDFREAFVAYFNSRALFGWAKVLVIAALALMVLLLAIGASSGHYSQLFLTTLAPAVVVLGIWSAILWVSPWLGARRQFRNQPAAQGTKTLTVTDKGLEWQGRTGRVESYWSSYIRWTESDSALIVFSSPVLFYMIPKRAFMPEQLAEFRQTLEQKIGPVNKGRKIVAS